MAQEQAEGVLGGLVDEVVGYVADGLSVHVVGLHGSGRSELLGLVADRLDDDGRAVLRLFGNPAWRQEPFAALVAAGIGPATAPGPRRSVGEMATALTQQVRGGVVVVCDDADELDLQSIGALVTVHQQRPLVVVSGSRPHLPLRPDSLVLGLTPAVRLRMPLLDVDAVHAVCRRVLGGPVDAATVARITMKSGGLHGLVRAIATVGRRAGTLRLTDGVWTAPGDLWSEHLAAAVGHYLAGVEQEVWDGATTLALTGPLRLAEAEKLLERRLLDRLFTSGLVHHSDDGDGGVVGLFPPLLAEFLRREGSPFGLAHARELTDRTDFLPAAPEPGEAFDAGTAVGVDAAVLNQRLARDAAARVAEARVAWQRSPGPVTALSLLSALRSTGAPEHEIEYVVRDTPLREPDAPAGAPLSEAAAMLVVWHAHWRAVDRGDLPGALRVLDERAADLPAYAALLATTRAHLTYLRERVPPAAVAGGTAEGVAGEALTCLRVELLLGAGRVREAREELRGFRPQHRVFQSDASVLVGLAAVLDGDLDAGVAHAREQLQAARTRGSAGAVQAHSYVAVWGLAVAGRLGDAAQLLFRALSMTTVAALRDIYHTGILVLGAEIAIAQGRPEYARALAAQAAASHSGSGPYPGMDPDIVEPLLLDRVEDAHDVWAVVDDRLARGYLASALFLAVETVDRAPDAGRARAVCEEAAAMTSPLLRALGDYVLASATEDEAALGALVGTFAGLGAGHYAVRAGVRRALALRRAGRAAEAVAAADDAWQRSAVAGLERSGLFALLQADVGISAREDEIVRMVMSGMTAGEIASALHMSVRTVETHVHNASRKVGVSGRDALVRAVSTWLRSSEV